MIQIAELGKEAAVTRFPAGQKAPTESSATSIAAAIVPAPEEGAVLVANPADKMIYYYTEGMAAPMGSFQNYKRDPRALLVLDNSLRETERGVYTSTVRLPSPGHYDVVFLLDSPRLVNCFDMTVAENPAQPKKIETSVKIEPLAQKGGRTPNAALQSARLENRHAESKSARCERARVSRSRHLAETPTGNGYRRWRLRDKFCAAATRPVLYFLPGSFTGTSVQPVNTTDTAGGETLSMQDTVLREHSNEIDFLRYLTRALSSHHCRRTSANRGACKHERDQTFYVERGKIFH
jgi:hypothetical protein